MVKPLKSNGLQEVDGLRKRVRRQYSLDRIGRDDALYIEKRCDEIERRIIDMNEEDE